MVPLLLAFLLPLQAQPIIDIDPVAGGQFELSWPSSEANYRLEESSSLAAGGDWLPSSLVPENLVGRFRVTVGAATGERFFRLARNSVVPAQILETSPAQGETGVSVNRETIFRFDMPLAADTVLNTTLVSARAAGRALLTRVELATDRRSATLFYLEPVPSGTRVDVRFDGFGVLDAGGRALDANGDGFPGGIAQVSYTTASAVPVGVTAVIGRVFASEKRPDGTDRPLPGVTVTVDGAEQTMRAVTAADGSFTLRPAPSGRFFVHVDGRTSPLSTWPGGAYYPFIGKAWEAEPGRTNNLAGGNGIIYLPLVPADALQPVSQTAPTVVHFAPSLLATNPALAGVEVRVPANALFADNGARGGRVGIAPVPPDRLPEPLPPGLALPLVITIQTDGPSNFDRPVPVKFPNLPDPVTGITLPPGSKTALWSFNHDTGRWEVAGPMTVTADGLFAETDPGVGVRQPGWHGAGPGGPGGGPSGYPNDDDDDDCKDTNRNGICDNREKDPCEKERLQMIFSFTDTFTGLMGLIPDIKGALPNCALAATTAALQGIRDCGVDPDTCRTTVGLKMADFAIGCAANFTGELKPIVDAAVALKSLLDTSLAYQTYLDCRALHPKSKGAPPENPFRLQHELEVRLGELMDAAYGPAWKNIKLGEGPVFGTLMNRIRQAAEAGSPGGSTLTPDELTAILALPRPEGISDEDIEALAARMTALIGGREAAGFDSAAFEAAAARLETTLQEITAAGWSHTHEGYARGLAILQQLMPPAGQGGVISAGAVAAPRAAAEPVEVPGLPDRPHAWLLLDLNTGFSRRGMLNASGNFEGLILAADTDYLVAYADPLTGRAGVSRFRSRPAGRTTILPGAVRVGAPAAPDLDSDGLSDLAELIVGTDRENPDTDGDGVMDGAEFLAGENPTSGQNLILGVIGGADTPGRASDLAVDNNVAVVTDGSSGVAVFDVTDPRAPLRVAQVAVAQPVSVAASGGLALVGRSTGATLLDVRSPGTPAVVSNYAGTVANAVALASPYGYFSRNSDIMTVDLRDGFLLPPLTLPSAPQEFAVDGDRLFVLTASALHIFKRDNSALIELSRTNIGGSSAPLEAGRKLFVGGGRAYVGYFEGYTILSVTNPAAPFVLARPPATQAAIHDFADNGSGLLAAITSFSGTTTLGFSLYDVRSGTTTTNFLTTLPTPGDPYATFLYRGLAFVADNDSGLQVINYLTRDTAGLRPTIAFGPPLSVEASLEAGSDPLLTFTTGDDVAVREVELFIDGIRTASAGSFPFQIPISVAPPEPGRTSVVMRARAIDTAGNERWTDELTVSITPDRTPPVARLLSPTAGASVGPGGLTDVLVGFSEHMDPASFAAGFVLTDAGPDGNIDTADDAVSTFITTWEPATRTARLRRQPIFPTGLYRLAATTNLADASGVRLVATQSWTFRVLPPSVTTTTPQNNSSFRPGGPAQITARFSTLMDAASLRSGGFRLDHAGPDGTVGNTDDVPVDVMALTFNSVSNLMAFAPGTPLRSGRYRAQITTNALDTLGNRVVTPPTPWVFTVLSPTVTAVNPQDGHARPASSFTQLSLQFTDPMDAATLSGGLLVSLTNGTAISGGVAALEADTRSATLTFPAPLAVGEYLIRATTNVTDAYGNRLTAFQSRFSVHGPVLWAVNADGRWDFATNWTPARPIPGDDVRIERATTNVVVSHTTGNTLVNTLISAESLRLVGGSLGLQSNSVVDAPFLIQGGVLTNRAELRLTGPVTIGPSAAFRGGGTTVFAGPVSLQGGASGAAPAFDAQTLVVETGPMTWAAGNVAGYASQETVAHWIVNPGATFEALAGSNRDWQGFYGSFWNRGLFRQTGGTNLLRWFGLNFTNDGVWEINSGRTEIQGSLIQSGRLSLAAGTLLQFTGDTGVAELSPDGLIEGAGDLFFRRKEAVFAGRYALSGNSTFESMNVTFTGDLSPDNGSLRFVNADVIFDNGPWTYNRPLTLRGNVLDFRHPTTLGDLRFEFGTLKTSAELIITNRLVVGAIDVGNGGELEGPGRIRLMNGFSQTTSYLRMNEGAVVEHSGSTLWQPRVVSSIRSLNLETNTVFRNMADGRLEIATNATINGRGMLENLGMLVLGNESAPNTIDVSIENSGTIDIAGAGLQLTAGGTLGGTVTIPDGAALEIMSANQRPGWLLSGNFDGGGRLVLRGGSNFLTGTLNGPTLTLMGANTSLRLPAQVTLTNPVMTSGNLFLDDSLRVQGTNGLLAGSSFRVRGNGTVRNEGRVTEAVAWFDVEVENAGEWNYSSTVRHRYGRLFRNLPGGVYNLLTNISGELSGGPQPAPIDNAGTFRQLSTGNARLGNALTNRGTVEITGTLSPDAGFFQTTEGLTRLNGGQLTLPSTHMVDGEIHGPGTINGNVNLRQNLTIRPGGPNGFGTVVLGGQFSTFAGLFVARIGGLAAGTEHDQIRAGQRYPTGRLRMEFVNGFVPAIGDKFLLVQSPGRFSMFSSTIDATGLPANLRVRLNYLTDGVEAEIISAP